MVGSDLTAQFLRPILAMQHHCTKGNKMTSQTLKRYLGMIMMVFFALGMLSSTMTLVTRGFGSPIALPTLFGIFVQGLLIYLGYKLWSGNKDGKIEGE